jgi:RND family efflux transporter MFP subunit
MKKFQSPTRKGRIKSRLASRLSGLIPSITLVFLFVLVGCGRQPVPGPQKIAVQTKRVESMESFRAGVEASYIAIVRAENETDLSFKVGGILDLIGKEPGKDWDEGTLVPAGGVLASLKQSNFTNELSSAQAQEELDKKVRDRFRKLRDSEAISQQEMDVTEAKWITAQAHLNQAEQNLKDSQLHAPVSGAVLARYVNSGVTLTAGQRVLRFADISKMSVELGVPDRLIKYFTVGKKFGVEISAFEGHPAFPGEVSEVGVAASQEGRLFRIVIKVPNPDGLIRSGMTATVRIGDPARFAPGEVGVPLSALITFSPVGENNKSDPSQLAVFVVSDGKASRRPVKTGDIFSSSVIVKEGLKVGEEVVTAGASFLYDGAPVEVLQNSPAGD